MLWPLGLAGLGCVLHDIISYNTVEVKGDSFGYSRWKEEDPEFPRLQNPEKSNYREAGECKICGGSIDVLSALALEALC